MTFTEAEKQAFKKSGSLGGKTAARNMSARARRERAMKAVNSPKSIAWREAVAKLAQEHAR